MNFGEIKIECWFAIDDDPTTPKEITDAQMERLINNALNDIKADMYVQKSATLTVANGVASLPTDFVAPIELNLDDVKLTQIKNFGDRIDVGLETTKFFIPNNSQLYVYGTYTTSTPPTAPTLAAGAAGNPDGDYLGKVTFVSSSGAETAGGTASAQVTVVNQKIAWTGIPVSTDENTVSRRLYRTLDGGSVYYYVDEIEDNTTTTYTDDVGDSDLGEMLSPKTFTLYYQYLPVELDADIDEPTFLPEKFHPEIALYVKARYMLRRGLHDEYARLMNVWEQRKIDMWSYVDMRSGMPTEIVGAWGGSDADSDE